MRQAQIEAEFMYHSNPPDARVEENPWITSHGNLRLSFEGVLEKPALDVPVGDKNGTLISRSSGPGKAAGSNEQNYIAEFTYLRLKDVTVGMTLFWPYRGRYFECGCEVQSEFEGSIVNIASMELTLV